MLSWVGHMDRLLAMPLLLAWGSPKLTSVSAHQNGPQMAREAPSS